MTSTRRGIAVQTGAAAVVLLALVWHIALPLSDDGKRFSHVNALVAFYVVYGCFICTGLSILLAWIYFRTGRPHTGIFVIAALSGLSTALRTYWPHEEWVAPAAIGVVVDAHSQQPIVGAVVSRVKPANAVAKAITDSKGKFEFSGVYAVRWSRWRSQPTVEYRIEVAGYYPYWTLRSSYVWSFYKGYRDEIGKMELMSK
jgi:hypothetical protein